MNSNEPVSKKTRIEGLDALRGLAVFGILVVNILQMLRTSESPKRFRRLYLRRIGVLILLGLIHAVFFYMADVLVIYGLTALLLLLLRKWPAKRLFRAGGVLLGLMMVWNAILSGPHDPDMAASHRTVVEQIAEIRANRIIVLEDSDFGLPRTIKLEDAYLVPSEEEGRATLTQTEFALPMPADIAILVLDGNNGSEQAKVEYAVFSEGPLRAARFARVIFLAALLILYTPFYLAWRTLALFMLGMAWVKWGFLETDRNALWGRVSVVGFAVGIPLTLVATAIRAVEYERQSNLVYLGGTLHDVSSLILAAAISCTVFLWCASGRLSHMRSGLTAVGRTALTNYFGQSVVMSLIATSYGLGLYGDLTHLQLLLLSVACFVIQMGVSHLWLRFFRIGPLEWIWRCLTYWRWIPLQAESRL